MVEKPDSQSLARMQTVSLVIIAVGVVCAGLYFFRSALIPFVIAVLFHFSLAPLVSWQRKRWNMPRWAAVATTTVFGLMLFVAAWTAIGASVAQLAARLPVYESQFMDMTRTVIDRLPLGIVGITKQEARTALTGLSEEGAKSFISDGVILSIDLVNQGVLVLIFMAFMLIGKAFGKGRGPDLLVEFEASVQRYVVAKFILSAVTGLLTGGILAVLGVEFAIVFGVMAFLLNFIPNIGSMIASVLPVPVLLIGGYSPVTIVLALALPATIQFIIGNVVEPKVFGKSLGLHPVVVILGLVVFAVLWGIPGMFLATPLIAVAKITLDHHKYGKPIARILEGDLTVMGGNGDQFPMSGG